MNRAKQWLSLKKAANIKSALPANPSPTQLNIYRQISELPLSRFIDCIVDNNLYALVITGTPDLTELQKAWANILTQYSEALGVAEFKLYISLYREISLLEIDYKTIHTNVDVLRSIQRWTLKNGTTPEIEACRIKLGKEVNSLLRTACKFNEKDDATYQEELNKCIRRTGGLKIRLDLKLLAFDEIKKKNKSGVELTRPYFDSVLISISDHAKYEITETITVSKYCERIKRYNQYCDLLKSKK